MRDSKCWRPYSFARDIKKVLTIAGQTAAKFFILCFQSYDWMAISFLKSLILDVCFLKSSNRYLFSCLVTSVTLTSNLWTVLPSSKLRYTIDLTFESNLFIIKGSIVSVKMNPYKELIVSKEIDVPGWFNNPFN